MTSQHVLSTQISEYFNNDMAKFGNVLDMKVLQEEPFLLNHIPYLVAASSNLVLHLCSVTNEN